MLSTLMRLSRFFLEISTLLGVEEREREQGDACASALCRSFSDNCPIALTVGSLNFGAKPYRVFDRRIGDEGLQMVISDSWSSNGFLVSRDVNLKNKLKKLRLGFQRAEGGLIEDNDVSKREAWLMDLNTLDHIQREDMKQKCRLIWGQKAMKTLDFFILFVWIKESKIYSSGINTFLKSKYSNFNINDILVNGVWSNSPDVIKQAALEHFSSRFKESSFHRPSFSSPLFRRLSFDEAYLLELIISVDEIKDDVWGCAGSKSSGPDGFNFNLIKSYWEVLKQDFVECIR
ncbi:hypothetical protein Tco_1475608 [Tanacetum coccineum]